MEEPVIWTIIDTIDGSPVDPYILQKVITSDQEVPKGWTTDFDSLKAQLPAKSVDPQVALNATLMTQIMKLNNEVLALKATEPIQEEPLDDGTVDDSGEPIQEIPLDDGTVDGGAE